MPVEVMVPFPVPQRQWIHPANYFDENVDAKRGDIIVMSYNILFEKYATQQQYWYTPSWALQWSYRRDRILREIIDINADVISLQEVDWGQYEQWFFPNLCEGSFYFSYC
jgi:CCR4-NOT transcription complex subunit 6